MKLRTAVLICIALGALATFLCGLYGIYHRAPTNLSDELSIYASVSAFALFPFYLLPIFVGRGRVSDLVVAIGALVLGWIGGSIYLGEMVFSREPSWGFSMIIAPVIQFIFFLVIWVVVAFTRQRKDHA
jgi:hypothetical protein